MPRSVSRRLPIPSTGPPAPPSSARATLAKSGVAPPSCGCPAPARTVEPTPPPPISSPPSSFSPPSPPRLLPSLPPPPSPQLLSSPSRPQSPPPPPPPGGGARWSAAMQTSTATPIRFGDGALARATETRSHPLSCRSSDLLPARSSAEAAPSPRHAEATSRQTAASNQSAASLLARGGGGAGGGPRASSAQRRSRLFWAVGANGSGARRARR
mmetsp:Transcript_23516/g.78111  ORF Transcript_23516/g.78111 Transcript_23516/m.78111 type:complete len:213 (+) Transcript_23516:1739-2377(+)